MIFKKTYIVVVVALVYIAIATVGLIWIVHTVVVSGVSLQNRMAIIAAGSAKEKANKDLMVLLDSTKDDRQILDSFLLTEEETSGFLTEIERIAKAQGVELTTNSLEVVKPVVKKAVSTSSSETATPSTDMQFQKLFISFSVEGSEAGVKKILQIFEDMPYHSQVTSFSLNRVSVGVAKSTISLSMTLFK